MHTRGIAASVTGRLADLRGDIGRADVAKSAGIGEWGEAVTSNGGGDSKVDGAGRGIGPESRSIGEEMRPGDRVGFGRFLRYFLGLGSLGFGGPIATVGYMQRDLVEQRHWMSKEDQCSCRATFELRSWCVVGLLRAHVPGDTL